MEEQHGGQEGDQTGKNNQQDDDQGSFDSGPSPQQAPALNWRMAATSVGDAGCEQPSPDGADIGSLPYRCPSLPLYRTASDAAARFALTTLVR